MREGELINPVVTPFQPNVLDKVRDEIREHLETHGELSYDNLGELKYLQMVFYGE